MACLHFSPKLLETNEHSKGAIPFITAISLNWPFFFFFFSGGKIKLFNVYF